jgi:thiamine phosphate synthase YjbQ (UPF0047 family)
MKSFREIITITIPKRRDYINITPKVEELLEKSGITEGLCLVNAITKGKLDFGPWEQIFYGEFDGNRQKRVLIKIIGE